ncbi:MFS transporter [Flexivirga sp. ID2601S]|uniref:MFS transporter n=1 Tax=Flexivirga aerilata TaxID=1656889 RepID=A0A849AD69_9MICO|nr:MFS transporter [Flexivirga aerilata]NNG38455.1 MFS transporter [Flexivirga aerilata]
MSADAPIRWTPRQVMRVGSFRLLLVVSFLDVCADAMWLVTLGWVAASAPNSFVTGLILAAAAIPQLAFVLIGGLHTDKYGAGTIARRTTPIRLALFLLWAGVAVVTLGPSRLVGVLVVSLLIGAVAGFHDSAMETYPTEFLVPKARGTAVTVERIVLRAAQAAGGFLGGLLLGSGGVSAPALGAAALLAVALFTLTVLRRRPTIVEEPEPDEEPVQLTVRAGVDFVVRHPVLSNTISVQGVVNLVTGGALIALLPIKAQRMGWGAQDYGSAFGAYGLGITVGTVISLTLTGLTTRARTLLGVAMSVVACLAVVIIGLADTPGVATAAVFLMGLALGPVGPMLTGYAREKTPTQLVGRVMAILGLVTAGLEPIGSLLAGVLAGVFTVDQAALGLGGVGAVACAVGALRLLPLRDY